jgi:predicted GNAT family acetyltransferase
VLDDTVVGFAAYELQEPGRIVFTHTEVADEVEGRGVGSILIRSALDAVGHAGQRRVVPQCRFVAAFVERHPEYQDLLSRD